MEEVVRQDIIEVLKQGVEAIKQGDSFRVKELSNNVIHNASIFQDEDSISVAVLMYALSKVMERGKLDASEIASLLERAKSSLEAHNPEGCRMAVRLAIRKVAEADSRLRIFVNSVIDQAQLKKGCKICQHGVSVARTANIIGISKWDLMQSLGKTMFHEESPETVRAIDRLSLTRKVFGK